MPAGPVSGAERSVVLVHSVSQAIRIERVLSRQGIRCALVPVPRHLSSDCGVAVSLARADAPAVMEALGREGIEPESIHDI